MFQLGGSPNVTRGLVALAEGTTLLIEDIERIPINMQQRLHQYLQRSDAVQPGREADVHSIRIIAVTTVDLSVLVKSGLFQEGLYSYISDVVIQMPSLRERREDIPNLTWSILDELGFKLGKRIEYLSKQNMDMLCSYNWPGNISELKSLLHSSLLMSSGSTLELLVPEGGLDRLVWKTIHDLERQYIFDVLRFTNGRIRGPKGAAILLGLKESTLRFRMKKLGISTRKT